MYYKGIGRNEGVSVDGEDAFEYALDRCVNGTEEEKKAFREEYQDDLIEWFYSGDWMRRKEDVDK